MVAVHSLSQSDVAAVEAELSAGKPPTVWFTPTAVGVQPGRSARVVSLSDPAQGEFIKVKPAGSRDTMFCSPSELTRTRPPRKRRDAPEIEESTAASTGPVKAAPRSPVAPAMPAAASTSGPVKLAASPAPAPVKLAAVSPEAPVKLATAAKSNTPLVEGDPSPAPTARKSADRRQQSAEVTVTLAASTEGNWTVEVVVGRKRVVRPLPVQPAEVAAAARSLPAPVTDAIETSLASARERQIERVEQLRAELETAQRALRELGG